MKRPVRMAAGVLLLLVLYLLLWPVPVDPAAWEAPPDPGRTGPFAENQRLAGAEALSMGAHEGPEDVALDAQGRVYLATHDGTIVRLQPDGSAPEDWAQTGGRPLGIDFDAAGVCDHCRDSEANVRPNWKQGDDVIILASVSDEAAKEKFPAGWKTLKPYLRLVAQPK